MNTTLMRLMIVAGLGLLMCVSSALAADHSLAELKDRFKARYPQVQELKVQGKVGETFKGLLEAVKPEYASDPKVKQVVAEENTDRQELFRMLAKQTGTTVEDVAARNAARNFEKAKPGEWLKQSDGVWRQKQP